MHNSKVSFDTDKSNGTTGNICIGGNGASGDGKIPKNKGVYIPNKKFNENYSDSEIEHKGGISLGGSKSAKLLAKELQNLTKF